MSKNPVLIPQPFANNGSKNSIQNTRQAGQDPEDATWSDGFPNVTMQPIESGGLPPKGMDFNGILNALSASIVHQQKGGFFYFDQNHAETIGGYFAGAILIADDNSRLFISTINENRNNPNQNPTGWGILAGTGVNSDTATKLRTPHAIGGVSFDGTADVHLPVSSGYTAAEKYEAGDLVKIDGIWYECYHPDGVCGKDPRDPKNRPEGWQNADTSQPYYWLKIGRWLSFPETGSPIYLPTTSIREGLIKYRNDGNLHKHKFWRLAGLYPELINNNVINIADLRAEFLRGLDDGRGVDNDRLINSFQGDAIRNIVGESEALHVQTLGIKYRQKGAIKTVESYFQPRSAALGGDSDSMSTIEFDASKCVPTGPENRPRNVALLIATRI